MEKTDNPFEHPNENYPKKTIQVNNPELIETTEEYILRNSVSEQYFRYGNISNISEIEREVIGKKLKELKKNFSKEDPLLPQKFFKSIENFSVIKESKNYILPCIKNKMTVVDDNGKGICIVNIDKNVIKEYGGLAPITLKFERLDIEKKPKMKDAINTFEDYAFLPIGNVTGKLIEPSLDSTKETDKFNYNGNLVNVSTFGIDTLVNTKWHWLSHVRHAPSLPDVENNPESSDYRFLKRDILTDNPNRELTENEIEETDTLHKTSTEVRKIKKRKTEEKYPALPLKVNPNSNPNSNPNNNNNDDENGYESDEDFISHDYVIPETWRRHFSNHTINPNGNVTPISFIKDREEIRIDFMSGRLEVEYPIYPIWDLCCADKDLIYAIFKFYIANSENELNEFSFFNEIAQRHILMITEMELRYILNQEYHSIEYTKIEDPRKYRLPVENMKDPNYYMENIVGYYYLIDIDIGSRYWIIVVKKSKIDDMIKIAPIEFETTEISKDQKCENIDEIESDSENDVEIISPPNGFNHIDNNNNNNNNNHVRKEEKEKNKEKKKEKEKEKEKGKKKKERIKKNCNSSPQNDNSSSTTIYKDNDISQLLKQHMIMINVHILKIYKFIGDMKSPEVIHLLDPPMENFSQGKVLLFIKKYIDEEEFISATHLFGFLNSTTALLIRSSAQNFLIQNFTEQIGKIKEKRMKFIRDFISYMEETIYNMYSEVYCLLDTWMSYRKEFSCINTATIPYYKHQIKNENYLDNNNNNNIKGLKNNDDQLLSIPNIKKACTLVICDFITSGREEELISLFKCNRYLYFILDDLYVTIEFKKLNGDTLFYSDLIFSNIITRNINQNPIIPGLSNYNFYVNGDLEKLKTEIFFEFSNFLKEYSNLNTETMFEFLQLKEKLEIIISLNKHIITIEDSDDINNINNNNNNSNSSSENDLLYGIYQSLNDIYLIIKDVGIEKSLILDYIPKSLLLGLIYTSAEVMKENSTLRSLEKFIKNSSHVSTIPNYRIFFSLVSLFSKSIPFISKLIKTFNLKKYDMHNSIYDSIYDGYNFILLSNLDKLKGVPLFKREVFSKFFSFISVQLEKSEKFKSIHPIERIFQKFLN